MEKHRHFLQSLIDSWLFRGFAKVRHIAISRVSESIIKKQRDGKK